MLRVLSRAKSHAKADARSGNPSRRASGQRAVPVLVSKIREIHEKEDA